MGYFTPDFASGHRTVLSTFPLLSYFRNIKLKKIIYIFMNIYIQKNSHCFMVLGSDPILLLRLYCFEELTLLLLPSAL